MVITFYYIPIYSRPINPFKIILIYITPYEILFTTIKLFLIRYFNPCYILILS